MATRIGGQCPPYSLANLKCLVWQCAVDQFFFPLVDQRPVDGTCSKIGHVQVAVEAVDCFLDVGVFFAEDGAVAGQEPFDVARLNAL